VKKDGPIYDDKFFTGIKDGSFKSAMKIIPYVSELLPIKSVVDIGCGAGSWLKAFRKNGVRDIYGIDGNRTGILDIAENQFMQTDLSRPFLLKRRFDLAVSVEVAEHLPEERADSFVRDLIRLAPVILFSAAIPGQGGTYHVNEQWPEYWSDKFKKEGYVGLDFLRMRIWNDSDIMWWYRQNILLYARKDITKKNPKLSKLPLADPPPRLIHQEGLSITTHLRMAWIRLRKRLGF
jgi:SAM-dependent methyltransferase